MRSKTKTRDPLQAAHYSAAVRALTSAVADLAAAGEPMASVRVSAVLRGLQ